MPKVLVTGFSPFDGRAVNASFVAASSLATRANTRVLEVPVRWGAPAQVLEQRCGQDCPEIIVAMGEGRDGWFDIETVANNTRKERPDNDGGLPGGVPVMAGGAATRHASIDARRLHLGLLDAGFPVRVSRDAGGFLCEEMLYTLESLKTEHQALRLVVFIHLPPFGTCFQLGDLTVDSDHTTLAAFANRALDILLDEFDVERPG